MHLRGIRAVGLAAFVLAFCFVLFGCSSGEPVNLKFGFEGLAGEGPAQYVELRENPDDDNTKLLVVGLGEFNFDPDLVEEAYPHIVVGGADGTVYPLQALLISVEYNDKGELAPADPRLVFPVPKNAKIDDFTIQIDNPDGMYTAQLHAVKAPK